VQQYYCLGFHFSTLLRPLYSSLFHFRRLLTATVLWPSAHGRQLMLALGFQEAVALLVLAELSA
jgi:hypothetical protein